MGFGAIVGFAAVLAAVSISASRATSKVVGDNVKRAVNGQPIDWARKPIYCDRVYRFYRYILSRKAGYRRFLHRNILACK